MKWTDSGLIPPSGGSYLKLKQGENKIRIASETAVFGKHFANKKSVVCIGKDKECPLCAEGEKPKPSWLLWVIDRADGNVKLLEAGYSIIAKIQTLAKSEDYGFEEMPDYDLTITKTGEGLDTEYDVIPARKSVPLTAEEKEKIESLASTESIVEKKKKQAELPEAF